MPKSDARGGAWAALVERARGRLAAAGEDLGVDRPCLYPMAGALVWSAVLLLPMHMFSDNEPYFRALALYGPEWRWGTVTLAVALAQAALYLVGVYWQRIIAEMCAFFVWVVIAAMLARPVHHWHGLPVSTGPYIYALFALGCAWSVMVLVRYAVVDWLAALRRRQIRAEVWEAAGGRR